MRRSDGHDDPPDRGALTDEEFGPVIEAITGSDYFLQVEALGPVVVGKVVRGSESGPGGFVLRFADETWVAVFVADECLQYVVGEGALSPEVSRALHGAAADGRGPLAVDLPYADEPCDLAAELVRCHGQAVVGLAIGSRTFNFCFPGDHELETMIVPTDGGPALRVFWEQW